MRKTILIGSILVLTLLLLMPSIPAIQQKIVEDKIYHSVSEKLNEVNIKNVKGLHKLFDNHFLIQFFVYILGYIAGYRAVRGALLIYIASNWPNWFEDFKVDYPIMFIRGIWLVGTGAVFFNFLQLIVYIMGWEW